MTTAAGRRRRRPTPWRRGAPTGPRLPPGPRRRRPAPGRPAGPARPARTYRTAHRRHGAATPAPGAPEPRGLAAGPTATAAVTSDPAAGSAAAAHPHLGRAPAPVGPTAYAPRPARPGPARRRPGAGDPGAGAAEAGPRRGRHEHRGSSGRDRRCRSAGLPRRRRRRSTSSPRSGAGRSRTRGSARRSHPDCAPPGRPDPPGAARTATVPSPAPTSGDGACRRARHGDAPRTQDGPDRGQAGCRGGSARPTRAAAARRRPAGGRVRAQRPAAVAGPATAASLTDMRNTLSAMQRGWQQGRSQTQRDTEGASRWKLTSGTRSTSSTGCSTTW